MRGKMSDIHDNEDKTSMKELQRDKGLGSEGICDRSEGERDMGLVSVSEGEFHFISSFSLAIAYLPAPIPSLGHIIVYFPFIHFSFFSCALAIFLARGRSRPWTISPRARSDCPGARSVLTAPRKGKENVRR